MSVKDDFAEHLGRSCLVENISSDDVRKAVEYIAHNKVNASDVVGIYDATFFGSMKKGFLVTNDAIYFSSKSNEIPYNIIGTAEGWNKADAMMDGHSYFTIYHKDFSTPIVKLRDSYLMGPAGDKCAEFLKAVSC